MGRREARPREEKGHGEERVVSRDKRKGDGEKEGKKLH